MQRVRLPTIVLLITIEIDMNLEMRCKLQYITDFE